LNGNSSGTISINKDTNSSKDSNKFSKITPEQDKAYMEAVNNGDMEIAKLNMNESLPDDGLMLSKANDNQRVFISNAEQAAEGLNMGKASGENWIKAIQGRGGLKAAEDKWLGLSDWLKEQEGQVSKEDVLKFIAENRIRLGEKRYGMELPEMKESVMQGQVMFSKKAPNGKKLTEAQAETIIGIMKSMATTVELRHYSREEWERELGGMILTPLVYVKMSEGQYEKMREKKRLDQSIMIVPTLTNPDVVIIEPSAAKNGITERPSSYVFVKTFNRDGETIKHYQSVTMSIDGTEVSNSNHYIKTDEKLKSKLMENDVLINKASLSNSSEWHLAEDLDGLPDLLPTQENDAISICKDTNSSEDSNKFSKITPEQDKAYMEAVNAGDMETAGKMVRDAANKSGYNVEAWHGTNGYEFNVFKKGQHSNGNIWGDGFYFTDSEDAARQWGDRAAIVEFNDGESEVKHVYLNIKNPLELASESLTKGMSPEDAEKVIAQLDPEYDADIIDAIRNGEDLEDYSGRKSSTLGEAIKSAKYDAVQGYYYDEYHTMVFNPSQIKSAEPVAFDDNGEIIPLSERFNPEKDDIRFSFIGVKGLI